MGVTTKGRNHHSAYTGEVSVQQEREADIALVLDFLNTVNIEEGADVLRATGTWQRWAQDRSLRPGTLAAARKARDALRATAGDPTLHPAPARTAVHVELTPDGPALVTDDALGAALAAATRLAVLGEWDRVKICPADRCRWAFYDRSRNRSRTWCSMRVCGNREKARAWRGRASDRG
jgi:predicted RNA-binding Zn ribbon-like protein